MLCPHCLRPSDLKEADDPDRGRVLRCSFVDCDYPTIPILYADDYDAHPPTPVSIIGLSGHGKTVFIESLLQEIQQLGARWSESGFFYTWLDEVQMRNAYKRIRGLREGLLPKGTKTVFMQPHVLRLSNLPRIGGSQLVIFDTGGEAFLDSTTLADAGKYVRYSTAVIWLLSLKKGDPYDSPDDVNQMMTVYLQTMTRMGGRTKDQNLILVLTKGDELLGRADLPDSARQALATADYSPSGTVWGKLESASADLEAWLRSDKCGYHNLVNLVKAQFKQVRYCIVSAQGAPAQGESLQYGLMPRGVMAPLLWLWRLDREPVTLQKGDEKSLFLDLTDAVSHAAGGSIILEDRTYRISSPLTIRHPLTIRGKGTGKTILEVTSPSFGLGIAGGKVSIHGLTIRRVGTNPGDVIRLLSGELELADVSINGGLSGKHEGKDVQGIGLLVARQSRLSMSGCSVRANHGSGVLVIDQGDARLTESTYEGNGDAGVYARTGGSLVVQKCHLRGNQTGLWIESAASATVEGNACDQNSGCGIVLGGKIGPAISIRGNQCAGNGRDGIQTRVAATPSIVGNACSGNRKNGASFTDQSAPVVKGNIFQANGRNGARVTDTASPSIDDCQAEGNTECGILIENSASGTLKRNSTRDNRGDGIRIESTGSPEINQNESTRNDGFGIAIAESKTRLMVDIREQKLDNNKKGPVMDLRQKKTGSWWGK